MKVISIWLLIWFLHFLSLPSSAQSALVNKASVETLDKITFQIKLNQISIFFEEKVRVKYKITNRSSKDIYLVKETPQPFSDDQPTILIAAPLPLSDPHYRDEYSLIRIKKRGTLEGEYVVPSKIYSSPVENIYIKVGFAYIESAEVKDEWKDGSIIKEKDLLYSVKANTVVVGDLVIEIKSRYER